MRSLSERFFISKVQNLIKQLVHSRLLDMRLVIANARSWNNCYCNIVWGSNYCTRLKSLHKVQKKIVRLMTVSKFKESTQPIFKELKLLDLFQLNTFLDILFMYSQRANTLPKIFNNYMFALLEIARIYRALKLFVI